MVKRAAVNRVVEKPQSKTVASMGGNRVLGLVKPGRGADEGVPRGSILVDMAFA